MYAFRCKNCGLLETAGHAGECEVPHACRVCGHGISFDPRTGLKKLEPENWEVLADATPERLAELGIVTPPVRHTGVRGVLTGRTVEVTASDSVASQDR